MPGGGRSGRGSRDDEERPIVRRPVDQLLLDPKNPRLVLEDGATQAQILTRMYQGEALEELAGSLARHGFFSEEPLVIVPAGKSDDRFVVVEGNRRLAAIKLLLDVELRRRVGARGFPEASAKEADRLQRVPTVLYDSRDEVVPYLGFRHITGVKTWDPYPKARYVASLVETGRTLDEIEGTRLPGHHRECRLKLRGGGAQRAEDELREVLSAAA